MPFVFLWLISLSIMSSNSIHVVTCACRSSLDPKNVRNVIHFFLHMRQLRDIALCNFFQDPIANKQ